MRFGCPPPPDPHKRLRAANGARRTKLPLPSPHRPLPVAPVSPDRTDTHGHKPVKRKRDLFPGSRLASQRSISVAALRRPREPTPPNDAVLRRRWSLLPLVRSRRPLPLPSSPREGPASDFYPPFWFRNIDRIPFRFGVGRMSRNF